MLDKTTIENLGKSAFTIMKGVLFEGHPVFAKEDEQVKRTQLCNECEYKDDGKCTKCNCILEYKIPFALSNCPIDKWKWDEESFEEYIIKELKELRPVPEPGQR